VTDVESFLNVVKSVTLKMSDGSLYKFKPMDKQHALGLLGIKISTNLSLARDPKKGSPAAMLKTVETEVIGSAFKCE